MGDVSYTVEGKIATIRLCAPDRGNAFTPEMRSELNAALQRYRDDDDAWMAVISGEGPDFCTGSADEIRGDSAPIPERMRLWAGGYVQVWKPTIAAVQGECRGEGMALALGCDLRLASPESRFSPHFTGSGADPDVLAASLINLVGIGKTLELLWLDRSLDADEALGLGLVNRIVTDGPAAPDRQAEGRLPMTPLQPVMTVPGGTVYEGAFELARELLQYAPVTRAFQKETALQSIGVPFAFAQTLEPGPNPYASEDRVEGTRAFVENRRPEWRNR